MKQPDSIDIGTQMDIARYRLQTAKEDLDTAKLTYESEQLRAAKIEEAAKREIVFDEDSPELTPAMEKAFRLAAKNRNAQKGTFDNSQ